MASGSWYECEWIDDYEEPFENPYNGPPSGPYGGTAVKADSCAPEGENSHVDEVLGNRNMWAELANFWEQSNPHAAAVQDRNEQLGYLVYEPVGNRYYIENWRLPPDLCHPEMGLPPSQLEGVGGQIVGIIHTHPFKVGESVPVCNGSGDVTGYETYLGQPSGDDQETVLNTGLPVWYMDFHNIGYVWEEPEGQINVNTHTACAYDTGG